MDRLMTRILPTAVAVGTGLLVLLGYLLPVPLLASVRDELIYWAVIVAAFAFILGFFNLLRVHLWRARRPGGGYSVILILAALVSLVLTLGALLIPFLRFLGDWWFRYVLSPLQATVAGLIAFVLAVAAFRLLRQRREAGVWVFLIAALIVLLGTLSLPSPAGDRLAAMRAWWMNVPAMAGMRGLLIGVGLGILLVGLRVLTGSDRPYSD
jgi:hypothetical protein